MVQLPLVVELGVAHLAPHIVDVDALPLSLHLPPVGRAPDELLAEGAQVLLGNGGLLAAFGLDAGLGLLVLARIL